jgi:hypothetical protein
MTVKNTISKLVFTIILSVIHSNPNNNLLLIITDNYYAIHLGKSNKIMADNQFTVKTRGIFKIHLNLRHMALQ